MIKNNTTRLIVLLLLSGILMSCAHENPNQVYYPLKNNTWHRFNILKFELPVRKDMGNMDVYFIVEVTDIYENDNLDFNMVMNTPSGEERINVFQVKIKSPTGSFLGLCRGDSCGYQIPLKKNLSLPGPGVLSIEVENLNPRIETKGISGVGILLVPSGK
jgi:gliding motility-associated lipoprotein GldH